METGLTAADLAAFTGSGDAYYGPFVTEAIEQAEDLFALATALTELPAEGLHLRLARRGILAMAESLYESQQYRSLRFSPFKTQTIGSYSYALAEQAVLSGIPTRVAWFDLAVRTLSREPVLSRTAVHVFDRPGDVVIGTDGDRFLVGPADRDREVMPGTWSDPAPGYGQGIIE